MSKSRQRKGDKAQKLVAEKCKEEGYIIELPVRSKWHREDFFSCWDIISVKENEIRFIQVSTVPLYDRGVAYKKKLAAFPTGNWTKEYIQVKDFKTKELRTWNV